MRYRCEILNHGIDGYEVWLHGRNQGRSGVKGVNVGNCAILENSNDFIEFVCSDIELNCFKYGHMKMCHMKS